MLVEALIIAESLGVAYFLNKGPARTYQPYIARTSTTPASAPVPPVAPPSDDIYTIPPVVITPDDPTPSEACQKKIDAFVAKLPEETRDIVRQAIVIGNPMQIDALATEVEKVDPALAACLRAQKKT